MCDVMAYTFLSYLISTISYFFLYPFLSNIAFQHGRAFVFTINIALLITVKIIYTANKRFISVVGNDACDPFADIM